MSLALLSAAALMAAPSTKAIVEKSWTQTLVVGHRGAAAYEPENTLPSFEAAITSKADAVECDVYTSKDGEVVVMHDKTLDRTTKLKGPVMDTDWATMKAGGVPSLSDLTAITKDRIVLVIEIKDGIDIEKKVVDHVHRQGLDDQSIVFSFGTHHIRKTEDLDSSLHSVWLVGKAVKAETFDALFDEWKASGADGIGFDYRQVTPELVAAAHARKIPVFSWTVPPGPEIDRLKAAKVNFIITNHPKDVREQLAR